MSATGPAAAGTTAGVRRVFQKVTRVPYFWGLVGVVLLVVINIVKDPGYLSISYSDTTGGFVGNFVDILRATAPILMIAIGMCLVIATGGIDLSVGSAMVIAGAVSMQFLSGQSAPSSAGAVFAAVALSIVIASVLGVANGFLIAVVGLQPFIATLVMMLAGRGIAKVITSGQNTSATSDPFKTIATGYVFGLPVIVLIAAAIAAGVAFLVRKSALGLMIEAVGIDAEAARLAGVNRRAILFAVYILSAALGGVAGLMVSSSVMTVDVSRTGYQAELDAILAVVIGGTSLAGGKFSLWGAAVGALLIATLDKTVVFLGVPASATPAFKAIVIVVLVLLQSRRVRSYFQRRRHAPVGDDTSSREAVSA